MGAGGRVVKALRTTFVSHKYKQTNTKLVIGKAN